MKKILNNWYPLAVLTVLVSGLFYVALQQNYRQNANDPQIQYVEDIKDYLSSGQATPQDIVGGQQVDIAKSLDPFIIIFDKDKKAAASGATLNGSSPVPPTGVFDIKASKYNLFGLLGTRSKNRFTWQPQKGVRLAAVLAPYEKDGKTAGYVLAGRNLREVENRIKMLNIMMFFGVIVILGVLLLYMYLTNYPISKSKLLKKIKLPKVQTQSEKTKEK